MHRSPFKNARVAAGVCAMCALHPSCCHGETSAHGKAQAMLRQAHAHTRARAHTHARTYIRARTLPRIRTHTHSHKRTRAPGRERKWPQAFTAASINGFRCAETVSAQSGAIGARAALSAAERRKQRHGAAVAARRPLVLGRADGDPLLAGVAGACGRTAAPKALCTTHRR